MQCEAVQWRRKSRLDRQTVELDDSLLPNYELMRQAGYGFALEPLLSGSVSATIRNEHGEIAIRVVPNEPEDLRDAYESMLLRRFPV
jgi:hypothetical protein